MKSVQPNGVLADDTRYQFERTLGQGGAGAVHLVRDRETGEQLALKKLFHMDAKSVLRLKREFRSLADMHHPNLVKLYDLGHASDAWFLTMEYVPGTDLLSWVDREAQTPVAQFARVQAVFHQLALGVRALHRGGMLHRDLKPSNVLVSETGRVVVLDFGLVRDLDDRDSKLTEDGLIAGTPAYMAPEQALDKPLTEASDWYAVGVMLFEALAGELPFDGGPMQVLRLKLAMDAAPIGNLVPDVPPQLAALCAALLSRDPELRPRGEDVLRVLAPAPANDNAVGVAQTVGETTIQTESGVRQTSAAPLFGRAAELARLQEAFDDALEDCTVVVHVRGASGAGKSALVEQFLVQLEQHSQGPRGTPVLALRSRCYEREAMPFKALDGLMDALVRHLSTLDDLQVGHLLPTDIAVLARLFPVLERLHAVQRLLTASKPRADAVHDRKRAEQALRELFGRVAARIPLVLWIDDLQWGDLDSASILSSWLEQSHSAPLLLVFSYRSEEVTTSSCLQHLLGRAADGGGARAKELTIVLSPLTSVDVEALCAQRLGVHAGQHPEVMERIVREAQGSPFLAFQLAALAEAKIARGEAVLDSLTLDELVAQTSAFLPEEAKMLLTTLAVAGRPMLPKLLLRAAGIKRDGRTLLHALRGLNLVRTRELGGDRLVEVYHDRVRERVQSSLTSEQRTAVHEMLLRTVEFSGQADPDWLHTLALGAEQPAQALHYGLLAAERASTTLAFERAAELYQRCLELAEDPAANGGELWRKLAAALACCGRGGRAGDAYLEAAKHAPASQRIGLTQLAASHLLRSGRFEEGEVQVRKVLDAMDIRVPETERSLLAAIVWERTRVMMRGMAYTPRSEQELPANLLAQVDLFETLRVETTFYDSLRSAWFVLRGLRLALDAGEPRRVLRALCGAANLAALSGSSDAARRTEELVARAETIAQTLGSPEERALVCSTRAVSAFMLGHPRDVLEPAYEAERIYREAEGRGAGDYYRRFAAVSARIGALQILGDTRFLSELNATLHEARATENLGAELGMLLNQTAAEEIQGQIERTRPRLEHQRTQLPNSRFGVLHMLHLVAVLRASCASGDYAWGTQYCQEVWPQYLRSQMRRNAFSVFAIHSCHARMRLNAHLVGGSGTDPEPLIREDLRIVAKSPFKSGGATVARFQARLALARGDRAGAAVRLKSAIAEFESADIVHEAIRDRYALGLVLGGSDGEELRGTAAGQLAAAGYVDPAREMRGYYPELFR